MEEQVTRQQEYEKGIADLTPFHDVFMRVLTKDREFVELIVRTLMNDETLEIIDFKPQYAIPSLRFRSVVLDVLVKDAKGNIINIEIERSRDNADPHRVRLHASVTDSEALGKGQHFKELPDVYVFIITEMDYFGKGLPLYRFERISEESGIHLNDGSHIIYVNGEYRDDTALGKLLHDMNCAKPEEMYIKTIADKVKYFKGTEEGGAGMYRSIDQIIEDEKTAALKAERIEIALNLIADGTLSLEAIAKCSGLSIDEVKELAAKQSA